MIWHPRLAQSLGVMFPIVEALEGPDDIPDRIVSLIAGQQFADRRPRGLDTRL
jgi:hypothetical protein